MSYMDLSALYVTDGFYSFLSGTDAFTFVKSQLLSVPDYDVQQKFLAGDIFAVGREKRTELASTCPMMAETQQALFDGYSAIADFARDYVSNIDL